MSKRYDKIIIETRRKAKKLMTKNQFAKCSFIIHGAAVTCGTAGAVPIPVADAIPITTTQVSMVLALGAVFDTKITESAAKGMISAAAATFVGRSIIKIIPVIGWGISAVVAAGITESVGWMIALDFARNAKTEWEKKHGFDEKSKTEFCKNDEPEQGEYPIEELMFNADNFISGKKIRSEHKDEFDELINDIEKIIDSLPNDHPLRKKYDELNLIIE